MSDEVRIDYRLGQHGWSRFTISVGAASVEVGPFGYCSDALGDLVRAALMIATSGVRAEVIFDGEPREWRLLAGAYWVEEQQNWTDFRLRVTTSSSTSARSSASDGDKLFESSCEPGAFVDAVLMAAQAVWDEYGADGYDAAWGGPNGFPLRALMALRAAISVSEPRIGWAVTG